MTSGGYTYTNDLDDGGVAAVVARRREQSNSPLAQLVAELGGSQSHYDYLDNSLSAGFETDFGEVHPAVALEDFVGVEVSVLQSGSFESNSVFDLGAEEEGTQTPSGGSQQSTASGTDFDTLPIAPMAKRPIEAPAQTRPAVVSSLTKRASVSSGYRGAAVGAAGVPPLTSAFAGAADGKGLATPFKYLDLYGLPGPSTAADSATSHPQPHPNASSSIYNQASMSAAKQGNSVNEGGLSATTRRTSTKSGGGEPASGGAGRLSKTSSGLANGGRAAPPAPPALPPGSVQSKAEREGFGFGIDTLLHGNQLGFGRQPSFKRIAPAAGTLAANSANKPYYLIPGMEADGANATLIDGGVAGAGAGNAVASNRPPLPSAGPSARPSAVHDRNAEAFSTWLDTLDPNANSVSHRSTRVAGGGASVSIGPHGAGPSVGEDFKREVDVLMRDLLGDYDLVSGATWAFGANASVTSGGAAPGAGATQSARRGSLSVAGARETVRQLEYDAFVTDVRMLTPTINSPVAGDGESKPAAQPSRPARAAGAPAAPTTPSEDGGRRPGAAARIAQFGSGAAQSPKQQQQQQTSSPLSGAMGSGAQPRRRRTWGDGASAARSDGISGAALDPSTEAQTMDSPRPATRRTSGAAPPHQHPAPAGPRPVAAARVPRAGTGVAAAGAGGHVASPPTVKPATPGRVTVQRPESVSELRLQQCPPPDSFEDMDEDLLAGGYMTRPTVLRSNESLFDSKGPYRMEEGATLGISPSSPPKDGARGGAGAAAGSTHGRRFSSVEGNAGASLMRQKWHPQGKKSSAASASADHANFAAAARPSALSPGTVSADPAKRLGHLAADAGPYPSVLLMPTFPTNGTSPMRRDSMHRGTSILTMESVSKASRRTSASPSTIEPILLVDRERPGFLQRVSTRNSEVRDDTVDFGAALSATVQPRRRLDEFRGGGVDGPAASSAASGAGGPKEAAAEAERARAREREVQQANEERRQRIQAFMAKRKAEKLQEESRRSQLVERDRKLEAFREQQERQRIQEATAPDGGVPGAAAAGSGLNAIKATQRQRKPVLDRPQRHSVATASLIPTASTVPMSPAQPPGESDAAARPAAGARSRATHSPASTTAAGKPKVRAVVVFISNRSSGGGDGDRAAAQRNAEQRPLDTNAAGVYEGTSVVMERQEEERMLRVLQPQDRPRSFAVDEFVPITDIGGVAAASSKSSEHSATTASRNTPFSLRGNAGAPRRRLTSLTLTEMSRKFLAGVNVALLLASTAGAQDASVLAIREVVEGVVLHMPAQSQLFASIANVVGGNTQDLLVASSRTARSTFASSPLFGPTLDDVSCVQVTGVGQLLRLVADAYKQAKVGCKSESGLLVISLLLKQCRSDGDVILSSYLITDAGCDASQYTAVLRKSQHAPCALFLSALGGPSLTTALMSADAEDTTSVVPLLNVQHRLASVLNKPCHVGSVRRFMELAQRELESSDGRASKSGSMVVRPNSSNSTSNSKLSTSARQQLTVPRSQIHKRLVEQVAMAQRILDDPQSFVPKSLPPAETDLVATPTTVASAPSTAPPSSTAASRVRLTSKQEAEVTGLRLSTAAAPKRSTHDALPSAATAAATAPVPGRALPSTSGVALLPSLAPTAYKTRPGSSMSAAPLKHQPSVTSSADAAAAVPPARRPSNSSTSAAQESEAAGAATRPSFRSFRTATATPAAPPTGSSGRPLSSNEKSVSVSIEYVRRGDGTGSGAPRNTGFMNFEDVTASQQSMPPSARGAGTASQNAALLSGPGSERVVLPPRPATTMVPSSGSLTAAAGLGSGDAAQRRVSADEARRGSGMQPFAPPSLDVGGKRLLPGATTMGANGPQWPSAPALEIPTIQSVASMDTSFGHDVSTSMRQSSTVYGGERPPIPASTKVRTLVIVDSRCRETSNVTYDNTMVIATTEDDFEEYDVDEVREATPGQTEPIQAELLTELCDTLMLGCNAAILGADSRPTGFSAQALKSVVHAVFAEMDRPETHRSGRLSASIVKVKGESVVDLLKDDGEAQKLVIAISPLFGSCVHGVTYAEVASGAAFSDMMDAALGRAAADDKGRDYGFLFCSLLIKLRLEEESDVQVCSLVATFAGENVGLYTSVLDRSPLVPRALFHYALGGPSYTIALLGIGSDETRANQMLQVQKRLGEMSNRATHPGSVAKFVTGIRNDLTPNLIAKYESSREPMERAATKEMLERLAEMVRDADALLVDFDHHQPKAYLHGDPDQGGEGTNDSNKQQQQRLSPPSVPPSTMSRDSADRSKNVASNDVSLSMQHSGTSPARPPPGTQRALPSITAVNPEADGERIQALVCFEQVMMGAGTVAVQGNTVFCASQGGTRFDSDEVITCDESHRNLSSTLMDELVRKFLAGHHTGLLAADSSYSAFTPLMLRHIANSILEAVLGSSGGSGADGDNGFALSTPPSINGELQVSIALIKDDVTADLLPIDVDATYHRFEMEHTPLYGPRVVGVTPHLVAHPHDFDHFLAVAIDNADPALQTADPGIMVVSLVLTQRVTKPVEDVLVSSLLCTAVFDAVHHYERVLEGNTSEPLDLFKNVLRGQCFSVALLGISDEEEDPGKLLRALNDLSQVRNRPSQVNSVSRHIRELQRGIVKLKERMTTSSNADEKAYIQSRVGVAEKLLEEAESLQRNPLTALQPHAFVPLGGTPDLRS